MQSFPDIEEIFQTIQKNSRELKKVLTTLVPLNVKINKTHNKIFLNAFSGRSHARMRYSCTLYLTGMVHAQLRAAALQLHVR